MTNLEYLAHHARPICDDDWGSQRQIDAQNDFFDEIKSRVTTEQWQKIENYCIKATTEEMIAFALNAMAEQWGVS